MDSPLPLALSELGFPAASRDEQAQALGEIFQQLPKCTTVQQDTFFRLFLRALPVNASGMGLSNEHESEQSAASPSADILLDFLLDVLLYDVPSTSAGSSKSLFGLTTLRLERLKRAQIEEFKKEDLYTAQMAVVTFLKEWSVPSEMKYPHYLVTSASFHHALKSSGEEELKRIVKYEEAKLEQAAVARTLMVFMLGSQVAQGSGSFTNARDVVFLTNRTRLADVSILQAITLLLNSKAATNIQPLMLQLLCQVMFANEPGRPPNVANKIKLAGIRLCEWVFHHCEPQTLQQFLAPVLCPTLLRVVMDPNSEHEVGLQAEFARDFRQGVYESLSILATRAPLAVAASEQAFQVVLVRCLVEEGQRVGAGANALKAFTSLAAAYGTHAPPNVLVNIRRELIDLLNGTKLFDTTKRYERVRAAVATWCGKILRANSGDSVDNISMRFALLKLSAETDEEVRGRSQEALYSEPLPSLHALSSALFRLYPEKDLKSSMGDSATAVRFLEFCLHVMKATQSSNAMVDTDDSQLISLMEYFVSSFLDSRPNASIGHTATIKVLYEAISENLVELYSMDTGKLASLLAPRVNDIISVASVANSRIFCMNIAALIKCVVDSDTFSMEQTLEGILKPTLATLEDPKADTYQICAAEYILASSLRAVEQSDHQLTAEEMTFLLAVSAKMTTQLSTQVRECSQFNMIPRGEEDQNARFALLRSAIDGMGLAGPLTRFLRTEHVGIEWIAQKCIALSEFQKMVEWNFATISSDGHLKQKLSDAKRIAIENIGWIISDLPDSAWNEALTAQLNQVMNTLLQRGAEQVPDLQFAIAEAIVALGTEQAAHVADYLMSSSRTSLIVEKIVSDYAGSRQPTERRSAATWLLSICAAGLLDIKDQAQSSWSIALHSERFQGILVQIHEFFVTMLNDTNDIAKECAVKGLAYLRLRAPSESLGDQFSDSLFRRLRCFRAFTTGTDASGADVEPAIELSGNGNSNSDATVVENAAYREVSYVAADIGDPELMYALLYLSTTDPIWQSFPTPASVRKCLYLTAFSFIEVDTSFRASMINSAGNQWMAENYPHKNKLVSWLYLLKFHSNKNVAQVLSNLWQFATVGAAASQEKSVVKQYWSILFQFLLSKLETSRQFKYREASCTAMLDLLHATGEVDDMRSDFLRLWKITLRAVDDVMESVTAVALKLFRSLGEWSLRVATKDATCRQQLLSFLLTDGMASGNAVCRMLSIDVLLGLVKTLEATAMEDILAPLLLKLLEYLSSLELPDLQYAQFHVEKKDQLERLRVSLSQAGPVGQLLDLATTRLKELGGTEACVRIVSEVARGVSQLLKFGVGLNTRVGTANFVVSLAMDLPFEMRKCQAATTLLNTVFVPYVGGKTGAENDQYGDQTSRYGDATTSTGGLSDGLVIQSYCRAAAYLCALADASVVRAYVRDGIFASEHAKNARKQESLVEAMTDVDDTRPSSRFLLVSAIAAKELVPKCPPIADLSTVVSDDNRNDWYCTHVFPAAFIGQCATTPILKTLWTEVMDEIPPSIRYADNSIRAVLHSIAVLMAHPAWDTRSQAALALQSLFTQSSTYRSRISSDQLEELWKDLLTAVPGRIWTGKGVILEALVSLASVRQQHSEEALSVLLQEEWERAFAKGDMEYMESAIVSMGKLSCALSVSQTKQRLLNFQVLRRSLVGWLQGNKADNVTPENQEAASISKRVLSPLMIKCIFESLALAWPTSFVSDDLADDSMAATSSEVMDWLCDTIDRPDLHVWSIRRAVFLTLAAVVASAPAFAFKSHQQMDILLSRCCGSNGVRDGKYSMIRVAAGSVMVALTKRHNEQQLALQLVVHKEQILATMEVLKTSEKPEEQQIAFAVMTNLVQLG